jgi:hypothetical protein
MMTILLCGTKDVLLKMLDVVGVQENDGYRIDSPPIIGIEVVALPAVDTVEDATIMTAELVAIIVVVETGTTPEPAIDKVPGGFCEERFTLEVVTFQRKYPMMITATIATARTTIINGANPFRFID